MRAEPSPKGRRSFRAWPDGVVDIELLADTLGGRLTPREQRTLGRATLAVWRHLMQLRGYGARWERVSVGAVVEALSIPARTVKWALARMRAAGLALTRSLRTRVASVPRETWVSVLEVQVYGAVDEVKGEEILWVPDATIAWCSRAPSWGGPRSKIAPQGSGAEPGAADLRSKIALSQKDISNTTTSVCPNGHTNASRRGPLPDRTQQGKILYMEIDKPSTTRQMPLLLNPEDSVEVRVRCLVQAYNQATREVFGVMGRAFLPATPQRSKMFPRLKDAAEVCVEHAIPPRAWAVWCMEQAKAAQVREGKPEKPPIIQMVFAPNYITKRRGWFRKTSGHTSAAVLNVDRTHLEQLHRKQEAGKLARGFTPEGALLMLPAWYADIRKQELAQGINDPLTNYPRARKEIRQ